MERSGRNGWKKVGRSRKTDHGEGGIGRIGGLCREDGLRSGPEIPRKLLTPPQGPRLEGRIWTEGLGRMGGKGGSARIARPNSAPYIVEA